MFRSQEIILRDYACTLLKSQNYLQALKGFLDTEFKISVVNSALWQQYCSRCVL